MQQKTLLPPGRGGSKGISIDKSFPPPIDTNQSNPNRRQKPEGLDKSPAKIDQLMSAAGKGDVATVKQLLDSGVDPDGPAKDGRTPLMAAAQAGSLPVIEALVGACADPTLGKGSETPLTIAFNKGNQNVLKALFAASFQTLDGVVGPGVVYDPRYSISRIAQASEDVPESAIDDLREVTAKLAHMNRDAGTSSPSGGRYGNYTELMDNFETDEKDSDMLREEAVRLAMKSLVKNNREMKDLDTSLH
jgi:ankyrin repeat protein